MYVCVLLGGLRFWTGKRRYPVCTSFDLSAAEHIHFAQHTACVLLQTLSTSYSTPSVSSSIASSITSSLALLLEDRARVHRLLQRLPLPGLVRSRKRQVVKEVEDEENASKAAAAEEESEVVGGVAKLTVAHEVFSEEEGEEVVFEAEKEAVRLLQVLRVAVSDVVQLQVQLQRAGKQCNGSITCTHTHACSAVVVPHTAQYD